MIPVTHGDDSLMTRLELRERMRLFRACTGRFETATVGARGSSWDRQKRVAHSPFFAALRQRNYMAGRIIRQGLIHPTAHVAEVADGPVAVSSGVVIPANLLSSMFA